MKYIKGLDTLRAFAVIFVIIWHWCNYPLHTIPGIIEQLIPTGEFGVTLFFTLSGYLITSILLKAKAASNDKLHIIKSFATRRILRLFPLYYLLIVVLLLLHFPFVIGGMPYYLSYTSNFFTMKTGGWNNFSHTWSLSVEEQFYLVWPWLILFVPNKYLKYVFIFSVLTAIVSICMFMLLAHNSLGYYVFTPCCFDAFGIGGAYAYASMDPARLAKMKQYIKIAFPVCLIAHFALAVIPLLLGHLVQDDFFSRTIDSVISIWLIDQVIHIKSSWIKHHILENRLLNIIGKISYGIYLIHYPFPYFYNKFIARLGASFPVFAKLSHNGLFMNLTMLLSLLIICYLSYELFEKRITALKMKFSYTKKALP